MNLKDNNPINSKTSHPRLGKAKTHLSVIIKEKRIESGLTQKAMGELAGVSLKAIRQVEQGEEDHVNVGSLKRILAYFALALSTVENTSISLPRNRIIPRDELFEKLRSIRTAISKPYGIQRMRLFGSYARGEAREDSDVDILLTPSHSLTFKEIVRIEKIFEEVLGNKTIDIVMENEMAPEIRTAAEEDFIDVES
ncbi:MAG TPA: nucleotidyltransferase domain-containing protein [Oligoflexus sp.]|uniref:nucleotidyltransferase domain-containing protein n=1 Tax=Oligoflexus sp. TaxID=1971216 RepID=UPI002D5EB62A|nr:nucleotidyltransferase domain-containing protein [Oligoflexus sp.]HYX38453.1 nucleotidyltransferase domain-containing protein [Oligoflexus sp.]